MRITKVSILIAFTVFAVQSCKKADTVFEDPYADAKAPLNIVINTAVPATPASGIAGTVVEIKATGLLLYKDKLVFMFNGEKAEIVEVTETGIKVKVPAAGSSGITSIAVGDQLILGPQFKVLGHINIDPSFRATAGANGFVSQVYQMADGRNIVVGHFNNYDNKGLATPLNRIVRTLSDGEFDRTFRTGRAANGALSSIVEIGGKFIIAGGFTGYAQRTDNISNVTSLHLNGNIDTVGVKTYRRPTQTDTTQYFPRFNGGTNDFINQIYPHQNKILAIGNFRYYIKRIYTEPNSTFTRDSVILDSTEIRQILRFNLDGSLDTTFRFNLATRKGLPGANGPIEAIMHMDVDYFEKLVVFGSFTSFDQQPAGRVIRLNSDGSIDNTFKPGSGADNSIFSLNYNPITKKYIITGSFQKYNGKPAAGIAMLNEDGTLDESFSGKAFSGGYPTFARQLKDGLIVVSGGFKTYNNVTRNGFMVLTAKGDFAPGYNATGIFSGNLSDIIETTSADGKRALLLIGGFNRFDNQEVNNIIRVTLE